MAAPIAPHAMPYRAWFRHISGDFNPSLLGMSADAGTRQSFIESDEVTLARNDHLPCTSSVRKPGVFVSTRKPRTLPPCSSLLAQTTATSAIDPEVIHIFSPFRT